jgi:hypothetical protein
MIEFKKNLRVWEESGLIRVRPGLIRTRLEMAHFFRIILDPFQIRLLQRRKGQIGLEGGWVRARFLSGQGSKTRSLWAMSIHIWCQLIGLGRVRTGSLLFIIFLDLTRLHSGQKILTHTRPNLTREK